MEPQAHYIPNNQARLKSELMGETTKGSRGRSRSSANSRSNYQQKYANGAGARSMDHIPDPQIIFNTMSSKMEHQSREQLQMEHNNHEMDLNTQSMASPLQLLSTAASCTPKLKITSPVHQHQPPPTSPQQPTLLPSQSTIKTVQNRAIKIIPANTKPVIIKSSAPDMKTNRPVITQSSNFKIQKFQLLMNKSQDGTSTTASLSPSATIVSGKAGQLVLSGKGITNSYQVSGKPPYTIVSASSGPKVIVQAIDKNFGLKDTSESSIPENQRITENTPIDFLPCNVGMTSYPKVIIQKSPANMTTKQIKLKLGPSLVNPKIIKGPIPANLKIQRNISSKGFTVLNSSQIVQLQSQAQAATQTVQIVQAVPTEGPKVDWEQELDDANRTKGGKSSGKSNGSGSSAKKIRLDDDEGAVVKSIQETADSENLIVETVDVADPEANLVVFGEFLNFYFDQCCSAQSKDTKTP